MTSLKQINPRSSTIVSFEEHALQRPIDFQGEIVIEENDANEYVFEMARNQDGTMLAAALSNRSVTVFNSEMLFVTKLEGHRGTVHDVVFADNNVVLSACEDKMVRGWDVRSKAQVFEIAHDDEVLNMSLGCGGTMLATAAGLGAHFTDLRTSQKIGFYSDNHTDLVTQVCFNNGGTEIATGSEDGLVCLYDTRQAKAEDSLQCIINAACPVRKIGFFAPCGEGFFVLTGSETLSLWHKPTAQCINTTTTDIRSILESSTGIHTDYLVQCHFDNASEKLILTAADYDGLVTVCEVSDASVIPIAQLSNGHKAMVRSSLYAGDGTMVTGGEDSRICVWGLNGEAEASRSSTGRSAKHGGKVRKEKERRAPY